jgi:hypothetical protein
MRRFGCGSSTGWHVDCPFCRHVTEGAWLKTWGVEFFQYDYRASTIIVLSTKEPNNYVEGVRICLTKRPCLTAPLLRSQCSFRPVTSQRVSRAWGGGRPQKWRLGVRLRVRILATVVGAGGLEPLGLLRWASIGPEDLLRGLQAGFASVEDEAAFLMREHRNMSMTLRQPTSRFRLG